MAFPNSSRWAVAKYPPSPANGSNFNSRIASWALEYRNLLNLYLVENFNSFANPTSQLFLIDCRQMPAS